MRPPGWLEAGSTWAPTRTGAPSPRNNHTGVWIGEEMVIWGGSDDSVLNTGGRYSVGDFPGEAIGLTFEPDAETLTWLPATGVGVAHELLRGITLELPVGSGASETCVASGLASSATDLTLPAAGDAFWYLSRGVNSCGTGTYGVDSDALPRNSTACP